MIHCGAVRQQFRLPLLKVEDLVKAAGAHSGHRPGRVSLARPFDGEQVIIYRRAAGGLLQNQH